MGRSQVVHVSSVCVELEILVVLVNVKSSDTTLKEDLDVAWSFDSLGLRESESGGVVRACSSIVAKWTRFLSCA